MPPRGRPGFGGRGSFVSIDTRGISDFVAGYIKAVAKTKKDLNSTHARKLQLIGEKAAQYFKERTDVPPYADRNRGTSQTRDGFAYRPGDRATGRFTFGGPNAAFRGVLFDTNDEQGFGYPNMARADAKTKTRGSVGAWRALEFGLPASRHKMPRFYWVNEAKRRDPEGTVFQPVRGSSAMVQPKRGGITAKRFIRDAWAEETATLPKEYVDVFRLSWKSYMRRGRG